MKKIVRGFKIRHWFVKIFKCKTGKRQYPTRITNPVSGIRSLARSLSRGAKRLCAGKKNSGQSQIRLGKDSSILVVPKGHLVIHVGESGSDTIRVVIPVIYFNHPLFGELLEQAERVHGFDQPGRIMIPCRVSDFEKVQMRIAAWDHCRRQSSYKALNLRSAANAINLQPRHSNFDQQPRHSIFDQLSKHSTFNEVELRRFILEGKMTIVDLHSRFMSRIKTSKDKESFMEIMQRIFKVRRNDGIFVLRT